MKSSPLGRLINSFSEATLKSFLVANLKPGTYLVVEGFRGFNLYNVSTHVYCNHHGEEEPVSPHRSAPLRVFCAVGFVGSVAACAPHNTFQQPDDAVAAKMRAILLNAEAYGVVLSEVNLENCSYQSQMSFLSGAAQKDPIRVNMYGPVLPPQDGVMERRIRVGKPFAVASSFLIPQASFGEILFSRGMAGPAIGAAIASREPGICRYPVFLPKQGAQYELTMDMSPGRCEVSIESIVPDEAGVSLKRMPVEALGTVANAGAGPLKCALSK